MNKQREYKALVEERKNCRICEEKFGLINQSIIANGEFDKEISIGAWSTWQGSLDAKILLVGQDWGDKASYEKDEGLSCISDNITDLNLIELFRTIGIKLEKPSRHITNPLLFFTNAVLCMKEGNLATKIPDTCYNNCANLFLNRLIKIIKPEIIITLGNKAYQNVTKIYGMKPYPSFRALLEEVVIKSEPISLETFDGLPALSLLPVPHCGQYSTNTFMGMDEQKKIWKILIQC